MGHSNAKCSFCLKSSRDVGPVVEGPESVSICADCIDLCQSVIEQEERRRNPPPESSVHERLHHAFAHVFRPVPQTTALLLAAVEQHYQAASDETPRPTSTILLVGPSRASRLLASRTLSHALGVPCAVGDRESLVRTAKRFDSDSLLFKLLDASDFDLEAAHRGIIHADGLRDETALQAFVDLVDGAGRRTLPDDVGLNVERILFICGAEAACDEIGCNDPGDVRRSITKDDLTRWGMLPDVVNRLHVVLWWNPLDEETLVRIISRIEINSLDDRDGQPRSAHGLLRRR